MTRSILIFSRLCVLLAFPAGLVAQTITNQPQSATVNYLSTAEFTVGATNATSYQWRLNGSNLSDGPNILGSTNATLTLENVASNQQGNYSMVVNNSVTSSNAALTVVPGTLLRFTLSGFIGGGPSNVDVQLFDHDKPATVENFLHYVTSGAYSNMFISRDATGFVIQGGAFGASNRNSATSPITGWDVASLSYAASNPPTPPFPKQVDNEFGTGPVIHNDFGTIAMALGSSTNSATSQFFLNTSNNASSLDAKDFTVFGTITNGSNVLQYFNGLSANRGVISGAQILDNGVLRTNAFPLPVNYIGAGAPANSNLVFVDFSFPNGQPAADTNPPTISITNPTPNQLVTNALPILVAGIASDDVALANIFVTLTPQAAADGTLPYGDYGFTNYATGTTNWSDNQFELSGFFGSFPVPPGVYALTAQAQDGAGNLSATASQMLTNTSVYISGNGTVTFALGAGVTNNPIGYPLQYNTNYELTATPGMNQTFYNWSIGNSYSTDPTLEFNFQGGVFTATFISNSAGGIVFTAPANDPTLSNTFNITGTINTGVLTPPVTITAQVFTNTTSNYAVTLPLTTVGTNSWSVTETNYLLTGSYFIQALATDAASNTTLITTNFNFVANTNPPTVAITSPANGAVVFLTNSLTIQGTTGTANSAAVSNISVAAIPQADPTGFTPNGSFTNSAVGSNTWTLSLSNAFSGYIAPGTYKVYATATTYGEASNTTPTNLLTISAIATNGNGTVMLALKGTNVANPIGYPMQYGTTYALKATPAAGYEFANWTYENLIVADASWNNFGYYGGLITANFVATNVPRGTKGVTLSYPPKNGRLTTNSFTAKGTIAHSVGSAQISVQIFSLTTGLQAGSTLTTSGTTTWSVPVSNLAPDVYAIQVTATNSSHFGALLTEAFEVLEFKGVAGIYNGLFLCSSGPVATTNSGFFTISVASSGAFSGRMLFPAYKPVILSGTMPANGKTGTYNVSLPGNAVQLSFILDITNGTERLTGTVSAQNGTWTSPLVCYRGATKLTAHTTPPVGKYAIAVEPQNAPNTNGYATLAVGAGGAMTVSGALPDGVPFTESVKTSTNGAWPVYVVPSTYKTNGMLIGWETNSASGGVNGQLYWYKTNFGTYFSGGVATAADGVGTNYAGPAAGNYSIVFQGGSITAPVTNALTIAHAGQQFKVTTAADKLSISMSGTGVISGHLTLPGGAKPVQFKGIFLDQVQGGTGIVLDSGNEPAYFVLEPQ